MAPVQTLKSSTVIRGAGRSYGDCAILQNGHVLETTGRRKILAFDPETGAIETEPGVTFAALLHEFLPRNYLVPVTPGTGFATIGGAVAHDVHGKNHEAVGSFAQHVAALDLQTPAGETLTLHPEDDIFRATVGGLGLTGLITRVAFRLQRVPGPAVRVREQRIANLEHFLAAMHEASAATYAVGWIDGLATGAALGRGILETAEPDPTPLPTPTDRALRIPFDFPTIALNRLSIAAFNALYWRRVPAEGREKLAHYRTFLYPLDALHDWNRIYGRRGFHQFQCVVPFEGAEHALRRMLETIAASGRASFLAVLKRMGPGRAGMLSFPMRGYTLALDFPNTAGVEDLYRSLTQQTLDAGGRIYLAKDALLDPASFRAMYPDVDAFLSIVDRINRGVVASDMTTRLEMGSGAPGPSGGCKGAEPPCPPEAI